EGGSLIHPNADVPATVNRNLAAANWNDCTDGWHLVSSPVEDQLITGEWTPSGMGNDYDFYAWSEPQQLWLNQKESSNGINRFVPGEGYLLAYEQGGAKAFAGELTAGDITRTLTYTEGEDFSGWNLLGNPFPSGLLWNHDLDIWGDLQAMNINAFAHTWDSNSKSYVVVPPGGCIPAGQGFMVQLTGGASADLTLPAAARVHESPLVNKSEISGWIRLAAIEQDNASKQESLLMVNPSATETFQPYWDAHFLQGFAPQFYSLKQDEKLAVFSLPEIDLDQVIPLGFVKNEAHAFRVALLENKTNARLFLYDRKLDTEHPLQQGNPYLFTAETDDDPLRFELRFKSANSTGIGQHIQEKAVEIYAAAKVLYLKFPMEEGGRTMEVFDPGGRLLLTRSLGAGRQHSIKMDVEAGIYFVRIKGKRWTVSKKIFVI
ncbi:MAG: T9SS type A sorting domain-containing protein, partial [Bacteroides sp.]|nr:T9SS type A sorting domain-containing protein [Bacteroides sp.]